MNQPAEAALLAIAREFQAELGDKLTALCVYGSTVRGNVVPGKSDLNLLIVLHGADAATHRAIAQLIVQHPEIAPLVVERDGFARTAQCFATKFASIQRNYRVLAGNDPLAGLALDDRLERLLCEQALRNLQLRATFAFIHHAPRRSYATYLAENVAPLFVQLSDVLRLSGHDVPKDFSARIPLMAAAWKVDASFLGDLLTVREGEKKLAEGALAAWHDRLLTLVSTVLGWIERNWGPVASA